MYQVFVYVPEESLGVVKSAMFNAGGGRIGNYEHCAWQVKGQGQFRPMIGAMPHLGTIGTVEFVDEWRVEMVVGDECVRDVIAAMIAAHPYEEVAYAAIRLEDF